MAKELKFQEWLNRSVNYKFAKETFAKYIRALNKNLKFVYPEYFDLDRAESLLKLGVKPLTMSSVEEDQVVDCFKNLREQVERLKTQRSDFLALFGEEFSLAKSKLDQRATDKLVYRCKIALDQYGRFLRGVPSELAMQSNYIRNHFRAQMQSAKSQNEKVLTLNYEHNLLKNLADNDRNVYDALKESDYMLEFGIAEIVQLRGEDKMRVTFI